MELDARRMRMAFLLLVPGFIALLLEPLHWLARTWIDPGYESNGMWIAAACALLWGRSLASGPAPADERSARRARGWIFVTGAIRLAGRAADFNVLGALALVADVYAVATALRLQRRPWPLAPWAVALLSLFMLPLERIVQRAIGYPLRLVAAVVAEQALAPFHHDFTRAGTQLLRHGASLSVDLPCSGARGLLAFAILAAAIATRRRIGPCAAAAGFASVLLGALLANALRVVLLFEGVRAALPVGEEPWHSAIGIVCLALGCLPLLLIARRCPPRRADASEVPALAPRRRRPALAAGFSLAACAVALAPARPIDVSHAPATMHLPTSLDGAIGETVALRDIERLYFERYGGHAEKRVYRSASGETHGVLLVQTSAPLRHLHEPDLCLSAAGHRVTRLGVRPGVIPAEVWRSVAPDGETWRVEVSIASDAGETADTVSEAVWRWFLRPGPTWSLVQRLSPWSECQADESACRAFDESLFAALEFAPPAQLAGLDNHQINEEETK